MKMKFNSKSDKKSAISSELMAIYVAADALRDKVSDLSIEIRNYPNAPEDMQADRVERAQMIMAVERVRRWAQNGMIKLLEAN